MEGEPLNYVKQACGYVVDLLNPNDVLSIVTFEETVEVLMPPRRVVNKQLVKEHIQRLEPGNTTNIFDGLTLGVQQLLSVPNEGRLSRLLLLTDGEPTAGIKDFNSIVNVVATKKDNGVTCTALGFGPEYNEELIAGLARRSGGNYYYIQRPELIPEVFRKELERMMTVVGRNLRLKLDFSRWVQIRQVYNNQVPMTGRSFEIGLVDLERGSRVDTVMELEFPNHPVGTFRIAKATLTYEDSVTNRQEQVVQDVVIDFTSDTFKLNIPQDPRVAQEVEVAQASKSLERTMMGMKTQQLSAATMALELQKTQQLLVSQGRTMEAQEVAQAIRDLQRGDVGNVEKTLIGTKLTLEQGKTQKRS
jgi:Ca-activated chloride channel family protein